MFMNDVNKKEEIRTIAVQDLRAFGIKYRPKKAKQHQEYKAGKRVFKRPLNSLQSETVTLPSGQQLVVPRILHRLCTFVAGNAETEGLFRKGGSRSRQNEIKLLLDAGCNLDENHHEIDVANVLKTFLRELPEPLIPYNFHELFLRCVSLDSNKIDAVLLACLLLPTEHLNALAYLMQFFCNIAAHSCSNKMDPYNIAVVIGPTVLPAEEKIVPDAQQRLAKTNQLFKILVENADRIGILPEHILERIAVSNSSGSVSEEDLAVKKKKKRRSGSLTRMINGIKKIVGTKVNDEPVATAATPDVLLTPHIRRSTKKRRLETGSISARKKKEVLRNLPDGALRTPIMLHPTPAGISPNTKKKTPPVTLKQVEKKKQWYSRGKTTKPTNKNERGLASVNSEVSQSTKSLFERRWSAVSQSSVFRRNKKRNSCNAQLPSEQTSDPQVDQCFVAEPDYVKISRSEYEEIKNRMSAIEKRISLELQTVGVEDDCDKSIDNSVKNVQYVYEKTLVEAEPLSPTADHLARRLSKELKIRRSCEQKVYRSPSARKIGSLRRRSRELEKQNTKLVRTQTWHIHSDQKVIGDSPGRNSFASKLTTPETINNSPFNHQKKANRAASFHGNTPIKTNEASSSNGKWVNADEFFVHTNTPANSVENNRPSLAKLRSQNAGMVLAKAKLFNDLSDSGELRKDYVSSCRNKIGSRRNQNVRIAKADERPTNKKSTSPTKRKSKSPNLKKQKTQVDEEEKENLTANGDVMCGTEKIQFGILKDCNRIEGLNHYMNSMRTAPVIKKPLNVRSPKRLCKTPKHGVDKIRTPMRVEGVFVDCS